MNITKYEFSTEDISFNAFEKLGIVVMWLIIQIPGNIMLFGIIQFDRIGGDQTEAWDGFRSGDQIPASHHLARRRLG